MDLQICKGKNLHEPEAFTENPSKYRLLVEKYKISTLSGLG